MRRRIYGILILICFIIITVFQYKLSYNFRINPPSSKWSKEVLISKGMVGLYNYPKLVNYNGGFVVAHDNGDKINVIMLDKMGNKQKEIVIAGESKKLRDINLLTDGEFLYVNWIKYTNAIDSIQNVKLDKNLNEIDRWMVSDVNESTQIGEQLMVTAFNNRIEVQDVKTNKITSVSTQSPSKLGGTFNKYGYMVTYYVPYKAGVRENNGFFCFYINDGKASEPINIMERPISSSEIFFNTATACDNNNGYIAIERKNKNQFSSNIVITFPLGNGPNDLSTSKKGVESSFNLLTLDQFIYSPGSVSSGEEARFVVGYARKYGRTAKQFNLLEVAFKDGKIIDNAYVTRTRQASNVPYSNGETIVYSSLKKGNLFEICLSSSNEEFKATHNIVKSEEIKLAIADVFLEIMNAVFSLFIMGLRWIIPGLFLIGIISMFGYKLKLKSRKIAYVLVCVITTLCKVLSVNDYYYNIYAGKMTGILNIAAYGMIIALIISIICYLLGMEMYFKKLKKDEFVLPFISFCIVLILDSILTQFIFTPFIM